ncbi:SDR family NAD(P)-dependent oxidoreductase [Arthrobacter sp. MMS18-M83]|uniref:SDR family NAD(P)-dependent oxidoreductase n=1 Tax=Arthrobacter sp. MMS18-M83 TaxID=2996261 RepID=UPI00227BE4B6|nr:SDR family NAD(P)-dependent oxidoreductase [Arthrobacter sp. MMS18-M83]WAH96309.1 SDR family NAD(P)-dependent oxidoreductase [Arthrobacter sp. MMS18-M83]
MQLQGKRIIVTGGAQGMGAATVRAFAREGAAVVAMDLKEEQGMATAEEIARETGADVSFAAVDVACREQVFDAVSAATQRLGGLDVLVNVAGVQRAKPAEELTDADFDFLLNINLRGTFYTSQAAFLAMKPSKAGHIINFGSDAGMSAIRGLGGYSATKGGVHAWTRTIALEFGPHGVRANIVVPAMKTPMTESGQSEGRGNVYAKTPLGGELGDPDRDLAPVMVFLAGDGSRFITGQTISVNGGLGMVR